MIILNYLLLLFLNLLYAQEECILYEKYSINFHEKLIQNNIFLKACFDVGTDNADHFYFLDRRYCHIFKVDQNSGKLIKIISSKGQAPGQLIHPEKLRIKNNTIYIKDKGYGGVKIFDLQGKFIKEFKTSSHFGDINVNNRNEIYVREVNQNKRTLISVYDIDGNKIKDLIEYSPKKLKSHKNKEFVIATYIRFAVDNDENLILLYYLKREVARYNNKGELVWKAKITNNLLDRFPEYKDKIEFGKNTINTTYHVFDLDVNKIGDILIGHAGGGVIYNKEGKAIKLLKGKNLSIFKLYDNKVIHILGLGREVKIYKNINGGLK